MKVYVYIVWAVRPNGMAYYVCASENRALKIAQAWHITGEPQTEISKVQVLDLPWAALLSAIPWLLLIIYRL